MKNNLTTTNHNAKLALTKSKSLLNITNSLLAKKDCNNLLDENWINILWQWADDNNIPDLNNTSDTIKNWYTSLSTADKMITIIAKKDNENYAKYKTDVSSVAENNKIDLTWMDYETLTETDLKYLSNSYGISNINDF